MLGVCFDERTGKDLNREMVKAGEAVAYQQFSKVFLLQAVECALASHQAFLSWQEYFLGCGIRVKTVASPDVQGYFTD